MKSRKTYPLIMAILIQSCSVVTPKTDSTISPSATKFETSAIVESDTEVTLSPSSTVMPSKTELPTVSHEGPYLAFVTNKYGPIILLGDGGVRRENVFLPEGAQIHDLQASISPTGEWIAMHKGHLNPLNNLELIILNIEDGSIQQVSSLIAEEYPSNIYPIAEQIAESHPNPDDRSVLDWITSIMSSLEEGVYKLAWSPDGRQLAFSAQLDGPFTDLYVYEISDGTIHRITNEMGFIQEIEWSPNGDLIVFHEAILNHIYSLSSLHVAKADGSEIWDLHPADTNWWGIRGWGSPYQVIIEHVGGDATPPSELYYLDIRTDQRILLWSEIFYDFAIDPDSEVLAVSGIRNYQDDNQDDLQIGVFLVSPNHEIMKVIDSVEPTILEYIDSPSYQFVGCNLNGAYLIKKDGSVNHLTKDVCYQIIISPDNDWIVIDQEGGLALLFSNEGEFIYEFEAANVIWRPDSQSLYAGDVETLVYITIPDFQTSVVYNCNYGKFPCYLIREDYSWLP